MSRHLSRRHGRKIHGILLLDKPRGVSSNSALQKVKYLYNAHHAGHTGALDPLATGMLPICLGEATKFSQYLLNADKRYRVIAKLGQRTDTSDADGKLVKQRPITFTTVQLDAALNNFYGEIEQVPSMYSALKFQGKKLYELARQGIEIPRKSRSITIYQLEVVRYAGNQLELEIHCSKGTYIRTLIDDLGELLGCGAHVIYLRRLQIASYSIANMVTLEMLNALLKQDQFMRLYQSLDSLLIPMDSPLKHYPEVHLLPTLAKNLKNGQRVKIASTPISGIVRLTEGDSHKFIGLGSITDDGYVAPRRLVIDNIN